MITILAGGTGSIKMVRGFDKIRVVCNVGDNIWLHGLYICPDIDTIIYGLADLLDSERGWGIKNDTFFFLDQIERLGGESWFRIGDRDLAIHVLRTKMLKEGKSLLEVIRLISSKLNIRSELLPATEDPLETRIVTEIGSMHLQEFWVKHKGMLDVRGIYYKGAESARGLKEAIDAIKRSEAIVIAPANPVSSIAPILAIKDIHDALLDVRDRCIAVSPIIGDKAVSGPAAKYMHALGYQVSAFGVASFYSDVISSIIIHDTDEADKIEQELDLRVHKTNILMKSRKDEERLASFILSVV